MRVAIAIAVSAALLGGCMLDPKAPRQDPRYPRQSGELKPIDPYKTDKIPDTAYEVWKRDKERNDKIAGEASRLATHAQDVAAQLKLLAQQITDAAAASPVAVPDGHMPFVALLTIFALARVQGRGALGGVRGKAPLQRPVITPFSAHSS